MTNTQHVDGVSRRTVLRGLGVSLALPWMESLAARESQGSEPAGPPRRMAYVFVPNGVHLPDWTPNRTGYGFDLPYILEPLAPVKDHLLVLSGLTHDKGRANGDGPGDHARSASVFLTGAQPRKTSGANIRSGISVDQLAAQSIGRRTRFASLELGCEAGRSAGNCDSGYSCAYSSNIAWSSETTPVGKETNPRAVFERLFSNSPQKTRDAEAIKREALRKSILDYVTADAQALRPALGSSDRRKLDEYLSGVRDVERRIEQTVHSAAFERAPDYPVPDGIPEDYGAHIRLMCDMLTLAFQTDSTRIATFMFANAGSNRSYRQIDVPDGHHDLSHHGGDGRKHAKIRRINRFHIEQLAYLLQKLRSIPEGEGTLLDHCGICYGSGLSDGNRHNNENLPVLVAGGLGGSLDTGRHVRYEVETPLCNLYLSMLERMGVDADFIGDSTGTLRGLQL